ncbi:MAG: hypothetical protein ACFWTJ_07930 [Lachnoclostridium sp.]|jgi:hypothetical protein
MKQIMKYEDQAVMHHFLYRAGRVGVLDAVLYFYCPNPDSISRKSFLKERYDSKDFSLHPEKMTETPLYYVRERMGLSIT